MVIICDLLILTGELIGVEYLFSQTGAVFQGVTDDHDSEAASSLDPEDNDDDKGFEEVDEVEDQTVSTIIDRRLDRPHPARASTFDEPSSPCVPPRPVDPSKAVPPSACGPPTSAFLAKAVVFTPAKSWTQR